MSLLSASEQHLLEQSQGLAAQLQLREAWDLLKQQAHLYPASWALLSQRAEIMAQLGHSSEAEALLSQALQLAESNGADSLSCSRLRSRQIVLRWSHARDFSSITALLKAFAAFHKLQPRPAASKRRIQGPLRIGYLSPDFRRCSAGMFLSPYFALHPQTDLQLFAYSLVYSPDPVQNSFRQHFVNQGIWRDLSAQSLDAACQTLAADELDILVDLAGHTSLSGLALMAQQLAPIQITGLTFNGPVGLPQIPWRLSDQASQPPTPQLSETLLPLPGWIYLPHPLPIPGKDPNSLPLHGRRLGCAHHPGRLSPQTLALWAEILKAAPDATLHLKHRLYNSAWCRQSLQQRLQQHGIAPERLHFESGSDYPDYLQFYTRLDCVLDPFPYHGGLVSCDALWMGLPMITLRQADWPCGGASLLQAVGFNEGIAASEVDYLQQTLMVLQSQDLRKHCAQKLRMALQQSWIGQPAQWVNNCVTYFRQLHLK